MVGDAELDEADFRGKRIHARKPPVARVTGDPDRRTTLDTSKALEVFLADVERRAFRKAMFATGSQEDALDIVQDAMFKLVQKYKDKPPGEWPALFYRILQSRINDFYRRRAVRNRFRVFLGGGEEDQGLDPIQQLPDPRERGPDAELDSERAIDGLDVAIKGLPGRQREAFLLRVWDGLSVEQTAKAMKCSQGSVKTHYSRAVHRLREELGEHWH